MLKFTTEPKSLGDTRSPLQLLEESEFCFMLTGSRRFGTAHAGSDFDFYVNRNESVCRWLVENGFVPNSDEAYTEMPDTVVYRKGNVDVQVRRNTERFEKACQFFDVNVKAYEYLQKLPPEHRKIVWSFVLHGMT